MRIRLIFVVSILLNLMLTEKTLVIRNSSILDTAKQVFQFKVEIENFQSVNKNNNSQTDVSKWPTLEPYPGPFSTPTPYPTYYPHIWLTPTYAPTETPTV